MSGYEGEDDGTDEINYYTDNYNDNDYDPDEVNKLDMTNEKNMNLYYRRMIAGECFRLPDQATISDDVWESWMASFMTLKDDEFQRAKRFKFLWSEDPQEGIISTVKYGVASDIIDLADLAKKGFIRKTDIYIAGTNNQKENPSSASWDKFLKSKSFSMIKIDADASKGIAAVEKTVEPQLKLVDAIVSHVTGEWYDGHKSTPGLGATSYFNDYSVNVKALRAAYDHGYVCVPIDMTDSWTNGLYRSYKDVVNAVRRRYGRCKTQDTMVDWFRKLDTIISGASPMEFKIQKLRFQMNKIFVTEKSEFPICQDFPGDRQVQKYPEEYNPAINTLLTYILFKTTIPKNRWETVQKQFHQEIKGKVDYKAWHENRHELWPILDSETKTRNQPINQFENQPDVDIQAFRGRPRIRGRGQRPTRPMRGMSRPNINPRPIGNRNYNNNNNINNRLETRERLRRLLCRNCSKWAGTNKYHQGPYGGTIESNCPYDRNGKIRPGYRFIGKIEGINVVDFGIPDVNEIDAIGLEYEDDVIDYVDNSANIIASDPYPE